MRQIEMLAERLRFAGLREPLAGALVASVAAGGSWYASCWPHVRRLRASARRAHASQRPIDAARAWSQASGLCQAASFDLHTADGPGWTPRRARRLRRLAARAFRQACRCTPRLAEPVRIEAGRSAVSGYFQAPAVRPRHAVVLLNGLDSVCEFELQAFAQAFLARGLATLSLDLPGAYAAGLPCVDVERLAPAVADWLDRRAGGALPGVFGVSFGGQLAARLAAGDRRFGRAVLVSPNAWFDRLHALPPRLGRMLAVALGRAPTDGDLDAMRIADLPPPRGRVLLLEMTRDDLFGREHGRAFERWAGGRMRRVSFDAEHVGTTAVRHWLPLACEWLGAGKGALP